MRYSQYENTEAQWRLPRKEGTTRSRMLELQFIKKHRHNILQLSIYEYQSCCGLCICSASSVNPVYLLRVRVGMLLLLLYRRRVSTQVWAKIISIWYSWGEKSRVNILIWHPVFLCFFLSSVEKERDTWMECVCEPSSPLPGLSRGADNVCVWTQTRPHQRRTPKQRNASWKH